MRVIGLVIAVASLMTTASAGAQPAEQTIDGAQRFLEMVLPGAGYESPAYRSAVAAAREDSNGVARFSGQPRIVDASVVSRCVSKAISSGDDVVMTVPGAGTYKLGDYSPDIRRMGNPNGFHWGRDVMTAKAQGEIVSVRFRGNDSDSYIYTGAEDMAARVAYAITFLHQQCDPAAATGF